MPAPLSAELRARIADAVRAGGTCRGVAREFDVSPSTVKNVAAEAGIADAFARSNTKRATAALVVDLAARRARLAEAQLDLAEHMMRRARQPYVQYIATSREVHERRLPEPPLSEVRHAATTMGIAVDKHLALVRHDAETDPATASRSLLGSLAAGLQVAYELLPADEA